jgi:homogentisate phytyltransferase/homogentisate geranylgeranyltransferase
MTSKIKILWQFSRPHTIIGSVCSITALYILACGGRGLQDHLSLLAGTLIAALGCNIFIVGVNQLEDVELDKINKPWLPLAAGTLTRKNGLSIVYWSLLISLIAAVLTSLFLLLVIGVILVIGIIYSVPPFKLKQHHLPAALCITLVRGFIVNVGIFLHYQYILNGNLILTGFIWCLTFFIMAFSVAIAWFKDLPDTEGDDRYHIKTLPVLYSRKLALYGGTVLVGIAYIYVLLWCYFGVIKNWKFLFASHTVLFLLFILNFILVDLDDKNSIKNFYLKFWVFFFAEYIVFSIWQLL